MADPDDPFMPAFASVGRLITCWARLEAANLELFCEYLNQGTAEGRAIAAGMRWDDLCSMFRRLAQTRGATEPALKEMTTIYVEAIRVKAIRDLVAHKSIHLSRSSDGDLAIVFEMHRTAKPDGPREASYTISNIDSCSHHAMRLAHRIEYILKPLLLGRQPPAEEDPLLQAIRAIPDLPKVSGRKAPSKQPRPKGSHRRT